MAEWLISLRHRLNALLRRRQLEQDLHDELAFHLAMREEQLRRSGAVDPRTGARRRFGNLTRFREDLCEAWAVAPGFAGLLQDFRYAARTLRKDPAFATVVVLTLGLGIGANTAFFSVVNAVLIRGLGYPDADRLVALHEAFPPAGIHRLPFSALDFDDFRREQQSFEAVAAYRNVPLEVSGAGQPERITGAKVSHELFGTLGVYPTVGRMFWETEDRPGANVAILSWSLWQRRFASDPSVLGRSIHLDRRPFTVIGIMPAGFVFPRRGAQFNGEPADVWLPMAFTDRERAERGSMHANSVVGKLKPGVRFGAVLPELDLLSRRIAAEYPPAVLSAGFRPHLVAGPFREEISGRFRKPLLLLLAAVGFVLLVACANVANLVLSRATTRRREFAVRTALGARRAQLVQLLFCEAILLSAAGSVAGLMIAHGAIKAAPAVLTRTVPGLGDLAIDLRVLAFTAVMCVAAALIFALVPLPRLDRRAPLDALRDDSARTTTAFSTRRLQRGLVVLTVSLACILLVGAGLFVRSLAALLSTDLGFRPARVLTASMTLPRTFYATAASVRTFHESLVTSLSNLPGVRTVSLATDLPLTSYELRAFTAEGTDIPSGEQRTTSLTWVHGPYFETLGIALARGRFFEPGEHAQNRRVVIVNEKLAALAWPGEDPVGKRLKWGSPASQAPWLTVAGVIRNVADGAIGADPMAHAYEPFRQLPDFFLDGAPNQFGRDVKATILADGEPLALAALVRQEVAKLDRELAVERVRSMDDEVSEVVGPQRFSTMLVGVFAAMALLLAAVGLYGLLAYTTTQRRQEIAVRMALGAERPAVMRMVIGEGARLVVVGLLVGLLGALAVSRLVASLLYQTGSFDPLVFAIVPGVLGSVAILACALPAWQATQVEPVSALRTE